MFLIALLLGLTIGPGANAQITVKVDSTKNWIGYMNYLNVDATWKPGGQAWALADLRAGFTKTNTDPFPLNDWAWVAPNTNTYDPSDPFWNNPDGSPGETILEQNFYVDVYTNFGGQTVTFTGTVISNTLSAPTDPTHPTNGYLVYAVVKEFTAPGYGYVGQDQVPLVAGSPFSVSRSIPAGGICQYGILVTGPNAGPGAGNPQQVLTIAVEDSDPAVLTQPVGGLYVVNDPISLTSSAVGATELTYQWQKDGTDLMDGGTVSGATTTNLNISSAAESDGGDYTLVVSDTAGSVTSEVATVTVVAIQITNASPDLRVPVGSTVEFTRDAISPHPLTYRWLYLMNGVTNIMGTPSPPFYKPASYLSGATTNTLTLTNVQVSDSGTYVLRISDGTSFVYTNAELRVKTPADYVNVLDNSGFENGKSDESPWVRFQSTNSTFGAVQDSSDTYYNGGNVNIYQGSYVSFTTFNADYSGIYQDVPAEPGQVFTADMAFYNASGDPLPGTEADNESYLEVQFRQGTGGEGDVLQQYVSDPITPLMPRDVWTDMYATNAGTFGGGTGQDGLYLVAPPGTTLVRFQVTMHDISGASTGLGSLYYDAARLILKEPATLSVGTSNGNTEISISWQSLGATTYQVQYKDNLEDEWTNLEQVSGDGSVITRSYPNSGNQRFYRVLTL